MAEMSLQQSAKATEKAFASEYIKADRASHKALDRFIYIVGFLGPFSAMFLIWNMFSAVPIENFSLVTWAGFLAMATMWFTYGVVNKHKPIIISYGLWMFTLAVVFFGYAFFVNI